MKKILLIRSFFNCILSPLQKILHFHTRTTISNATQGLQPPENEMKKKVALFCSLSDCDVIVHFWNWPVKCFIADKYWKIKFNSFSKIRIFQKVKLFDIHFWMNNKNVIHLHAVFQLQRRNNCFFFNTYTVKIYIFSKFWEFLFH